MTFDFRGRAAQRELAEAAKRKKESERREKIQQRAASLEASFLDFLQDALHRPYVTAMRANDTVTFQDGEKVAEVRVVEPAQFRVRKGKGPIKAEQPWDEDAVVATSDNALIDLLDSWAHEK